MGVRTDEPFLILITNVIDYFTAHKQGRRLLFFFTVNFYSWLIINKLCGHEIEICSDSAYPENNSIVFRVRCGTLNTNQSKECECVVEFPLIHFNFLI